MLKDEILSAVDTKINEHISKVMYRPFKLDKKKDYCKFIEFPNGEYLRDRYNEFIPTLSDCVFKPQTKRRYLEFNDGIIGEDELMKYLGSNLRVMSVNNKTINIAYDDIESFDELVTRIYIEVLEYARDCYRKEYLEEHTEIKHDVNEFYGKWIENFKPNQVRGIEQGDFIAVKVEYTDGSGFDIKIGWYDKSIKDNDYNIFVSNIDGEYNITAWCPIPK